MLGLFWYAKNTIERHLLYLIDKLKKFPLIFAKNLVTC